MSSAIEKMNHQGSNDVKSTNGLKEAIKHNATMFVCEEHVTLWITPKSNRKTGTK